MYQISFKIEPGLRGLSCSDFGAHATQQPDNERGVAVELAGDGERDALVQLLESHFAQQRFSNNASAFESVKTFVLEWALRQKS